MSYCRWSSEDFQCDVYVYEHCDGGWTTHVAGLRYVFAEPLPEEVLFSEETCAAWIERHEKVSAMLNPDTMVAIGLPHDGKTFSDETPGDCADRLETLQKLGYRVPQYAIDDLREEHNAAVRHP